LAFWENEGLNRFLVMSGSLKQPDLIIAYAKMLSSLASGPHKADRANELLKVATVSAYVPRPFFSLCFSSFLRLSDVHV